MATANGRARSYSAPVVALLNASQQQGNGVRRGAGGAGLARQGGHGSRPHSTAGSSPLLAIRSMHHHQPKSHLNNATSFPTVLHHDITAGAVPNLATRRASRLIDNRIRTVSVSSTRDSLEMKCCRINVLLVTMQFCLGVAVTGLGLYMQTLSPSLGLRDCPFWAGAPLLLAGILGIYFCATDFSAYQGSTRAYAIKVICFILSGSCVFLCMIGSVFPGIHGSRISSFSHCNTTDLTCYCSRTADPSAKVYVYQEVGSCSVLQTSVKDYLILECALNAIASGVCLWFITLLWKSKYSDYYSGLRFFSYSANIPSHPWGNPPRPPYLVTEPPSPIHAFYKPHSKRTPPRSDTTEVDVQRPLHGDDT